MQFFICKTSINPRDFKGTTKLVCTGIFRFSRNPMYLSLLLILLAWTLWLGNSLAWLGVIIFILVINQFQIAREETYLENKFGDEYRRYKQKSKTLAIKKTPSRGRCFYQIKIYFFGACIKRKKSLSGFKIIILSEFAKLAS